MILCACGSVPVDCSVSVAAVLGLAGGVASGPKEAVEVEDVVDDEEGRTDCSVNMNCRGNKYERMIPM